MVTKTRTGTDMAMNLHSKNRFRAAGGCLVAALALLFQADIARAAGGDVKWQYGHAATDKQEAFASATDSQGNVIITGSTVVSGQGENFFTVKMQANGSGTIWAKGFDLAGLDDRALAVAVDANDDVFVTGYATGGAAVTIHTIKYCGVTRGGSGGCTAGDVVWQHSFSSAATGYNYPIAIAVDAVNDIYIAGYTQASGGTDDGIIIKYGPDGPSANGQPLWSVTYNGAAGGIDRFTSIAAFGSQGVAVTGFTRNAKTPSADFDLLTLRYDSSGLKLWEKIYDRGPGDDQGEHVLIDSGGNVLVTAKSWSGTQEDIYTAKYAAGNGSLLWQAFYTNGTHNEPKNMALDEGGDVYVTGVTFTTTGLNDVATIRYSTVTGLPVWTQVFGTGTDNQDIVADIALDLDGDVFVAGYTHKDSTGDDDFLTAKIKKDTGNLLWVQNFDGPAHRSEQSIALDAGLTPAGEVVVAGWSDMGTVTSPDYNFYAVMYDGGLMDSPTNLTATATGDSVQVDIQLAWMDNSVGEDHFVIERCQGIGCTNFTALATTAANLTSYTDTNVPQGLWYSYRVKASSATAGDSHPSSEASALAMVFAPTPPSWMYLYNGPENAEDMAYAVAVGPDLNPVVTGTSLSPNAGSGRFDYFTVKLNRATASPLWSIRYNDPDDEDDIATCLAVDQANDVIVSGYASLFSGGVANSNDIYTLKYLSTGPPQYGDPAVWSAQYDGPAQNDDRAESIDATTDSSKNVAVVGYGRNALHNDDIYVLKYLSNGSRAWAASPYDRGGNDYPAKVTFDPSGNIILTGKSHNGTDYDIITRKYKAADGTVLWTKIYNGMHGNDVGNDIAVDASGDVYIAGSVMNSAGNLDIYVTKYDAVTGNDLWNGGVVIDGTGQGFDEAATIGIDGNGMVMVAGSTSSLSGTADFILLRLTSQGATVWQKTLERPGKDDYAVDMSVDKDGNVCIAGDSSNGLNFDILAVRYDASGNLLGGTLYNGAGNGDDIVKAVAANAAGEAFIAGATTNGSGNYDYFVARCNGDVLLAPTLAAPTPLYTSVQLAWTDNTVLEDGFTIQRKLGNCAATSTWATVATLVANTTQYTDGGLTPAQQYCYRIQAYTNGGETSPWVQTETTTTVPPPPSALTATAVNTTRVSLTWTDNTTGEDGFRIERCAGASCTNFTEIGISATTSYTDDAACENTSYQYRVLAYKSANWTSGYSGIAPATTPAKMAAPTLTATAASEGEAKLSWTTASDDYESVKLYRCEGSGCSSFALLATLPKPLAASNNVVNLLMNESKWTGAAGEVKDASGKGNNGQASGGVTTAAGGHEGRMGNFDGVDDQVVWAYAGGIPANNFTMAAWVKATTTHEIDTESTSGTVGTSGQRYLFGANYSSNGAGAGVSVGTNGISVYEHTGGYMPALAVASVTLPAGWNHVAVTYTNRQPRIYLNGVLVKTGQTSPQPNVYAPTAVGGGTYGYFPGQVDQVTIYNRSFSDTEVQSLFSATATAMMYSDFTVQPGITYRYRLDGVKSGICSGGWTSTGIEKDVTVPAVQPPAGVTATAQDTTSVRVAWTDGTSYETGFVVSRCQGAGCTNFTTLTTTAADATSYLDTGLCSGTVYLYRVGVQHAGCAGGVCTSSPVTVTTTTPGAPTTMNASRVNESTIQLSWTDPANDETGFEIERCSGTGCTFSGAPVTVAANTTSYTDRSLAADTLYRYRVRAVKSGTCPWAGGYSPIAQATTTVTAPVLTASASSTTSAALSWTDTTSVETGFAVERCQDAGCSTFTRVATTAAGATSYADTGLCNATTYNFRVKAVDEGLSGGGGGCWTKKAPVTVTSFAPQSVTRIDVTYDADMRPDFSDLRFYDESSGQELPIWFESVRPGQKATVWIKTDATANIGMYYGNASAVSASNPAAFGVEFHDDFQGNTINQAKWEEIDTTANSIQQNNNLLLKTVSPVNWVYALISDQTFTRTAGKTFYARLTPKETAGSNYFMAGWELNQATNPDYSQLVHGLYFYDYYFGAYEKGTWRSYSTYVGYSKGIEYEVRVELLANGAKYYVRQGAGSSWQLVVTVSGLTDSPLRIAIHNYSHEADISSVAVVPATSVPTLTGTVGTEQTSSCFTFLTWEKASAPVTVTTPAPVAPGTLAGAGASESEVNLTWTDGNPDETSYVIEHCVGSGCTDFTPTGTTAANAVSYKAGGLSLGTIYTFRVMAHKEASCPWDGPAATVTASTLSPPPPSNLGVTATGSTTVSLAWTDNTGSETGFAVERCTGAACTDFTLLEETAANATTYNDITACADTQYRYRVKAVNRTGATLNWESAPSTEVDATTAAAPTAAPALAVSRVSEVELSLAWADTYADESGFAVERCAGTGCTAFAPLSTTATNATGHSDKTVSPDTTYCYRVRPVNSASCGWTGAWSNTQCAASTTVAPGSFTTTVRDTTTVDLAWTDNTASETGFGIYRCTGAGCSTFTTPLATVAANTTAYTDSTAAQSAIYRYAVRALAGSNPQTVSGDVTMPTPAAPGAPSAIVVSEIQLNLAWADNTADETGFRIERGNSSCAAFVEIGTTLANATTFTDNTVTAGTTVCYRVRAYKNAASPWTSAYSPTTVATATIAAPSGLAATASNTTQVNLTWTDLTASETGFEVERCQGAGCTTFASLATTAANATSYSDSTACNGVTYRYRVRSVKSGSWNSAYSTPTSNVVLPTPVAPVLTLANVENGSVGLTWTDPNTDESGFTVERCQGTGCTDFTTLQTLAANTTSFADATVVPSTNYCYRVKASKTAACSWTTTSASACILSLQQSPAGLTATALSSRAVRLAWTDRSSDEDGFEIEKKLWNGKFLSIDTVGANVTTYTNTFGIDPGTDVTFRVRARRGADRSAYTNEATVRTPAWQPVDGICVQ